MSVLSHPGEDMKNFRDERSYMSYSGVHGRWNVYPKESTGKWHSNPGCSLNDFQFIYLLNNIMNLLCRQHTWTLVLGSCLLRLWRAIERCMSFNSGKNCRQKLNLSFAEYLPTVRYIHIHIHACTHTYTQYFNIHSIHSVLRRYELLFLYSQIWKQRLSEVK